jgi:hypothetical protein
MPTAVPVSSRGKHEPIIDEHNLAVTRSIDWKPTMRPRLPALLAASLMIIGTISAQAAPDRVALVIGNGTYSFASHLKNPINDAADMAGALRDIGFTVIDGIDLDRRAMEEKIRAFGNTLGSARIALFFYAGHGMQVAGKNYLIPVDARLQKPGDLALDTVDVQVVLQQMEVQPRVNLVFLDACRDNPLARSFASALGASRSAAVGQGLASIQSTVGTMIAFATQPDNVALDGEMAARYLRHIRSLTEPARSKFVRDQRAWRERNLCGHDVKCLTTRYQERLTAFQR